MVGVCTPATMVGGMYPGYHGGYTPPYYHGGYTPPCIHPYYTTLGTPSVSHGQHQHCRTCGHWQRCVQRVPGL